MNGVARRMKTAACNQTIDPTQKVECTFENIKNNALVSECTQFKNIMGGQICVNVGYSKSGILNSNAPNMGANASVELNIPFGN